MSASPALIPTPEQNKPPKASVVEAVTKYAKAVTALSGAAGVLKGIFAEVLRLLNGLLF